MRSYIATYFLCDECRNNFALEAADVDSDVTDDRSAVMWLWRTHNRVNSRLHGDPTEDPGYPKVPLDMRRFINKTENCHNVFRKKI